MMLIRTSTESWNAEYTVQGNRDAQIVRIKSRSSITAILQSTKYNEIHKRIRNMKRSGAE